MKKEYSEKELEIGYSCDTCHGRSMIPSGNTIVHMCEDAMLPIPPSEVIGGIVRQMFSDIRENDWKGELDVFVQKHRLQSTKTSDFDIVMLKDFIEALLKRQQEKVLKLISDEIATCHTEGYGPTSRLTSLYMKL